MRSSLLCLAVADDAGFEGAVGGASSNSASDDLADFADVFQSSMDSQKAGRDEAADVTKRPQSAAAAVSLSTPLFPTSQSLHPPQFHRPASHGGRQSEPHHMVRSRAWKERHSEVIGGSADRHHGHHPHHHHHTPSTQRPMNPGINVWVSTNGQLSGSSAMDKTQAGSLAGPGGPAAELEDTTLPVPMRPQTVTEKKTDQSQSQQEQAEKGNRASQDSGNPLIEVTEALKSPGSAADPADALVDLEQTEPLTLAEQQNTRIDENCLSSALSMLYPFSTEGDGVAPLSTNANNNRSVETLKDSFGVSSGAGDNLANVSSRSVDSAIELLCEDDSAFKDVKVNGGTALSARGTAEEKERGTPQKNGAAPLGGAPGFLQRNSPDNVSVRSDEKVPAFSTCLVSDYLASLVTSFC